MVLGSKGAAFAMSNKQFVHLHTHSAYSMLDGLSDVDVLFQRAAELGMPALAITDHGNMHAAYDTYKMGKKHGVRGIVGIEAYMAPGSTSRKDKKKIQWAGGGDDDVSGGGAFHHITLLAENNAGRHNLFKISSEAYMSGFYRKPRCLLPGQEIITRQGVKHIEDVEVGDLVLTHRGRFRKVTKRMKRRYKGEIYGVKLAASYTRVTWVTDEHPILIRNQAGETSWVEAKDVIGGRPQATEKASNWNSWVCLPRVGRENPIESIQVADYVHDWQVHVDEERGTNWRKEVLRSRSGATHHYKQFPTTIELDTDFGFLIGMFISEGNASRGQSVHFYLHEDETEYINRLIQIVDKLFGLKAYTKKPNRRDYHGIEVVVNSSLLSSLLETLCGKGARNKHFPDFIFDSPRNFHEEGYYGVLAGDGSSGTEKHVKLEQTSESLNWQMRTLAASLYGDFANTYLVKRKRETHNQAYLTYVTRPGMENSFIHRHTALDKEYVYKPIKEVLKRSYSGWVYNIEVEEDHSYVSDFAMHNCDKELLAEWNEGIIASTGCPSGEVQTWLRLDEYDNAKAAAGDLLDIFGRDNLFVELMDHGLSIETRVRQDLLRLAKEINLPLLATNDAHYARQDQAAAHSHMLCVQSGAKLSDPNRFQFDGDGYYLKSADEMRLLFSNHEDACDNTLWIAERCDVSFNEGADLVPRFPVPEGETEDSWFEKEVYRGLERRFPNGVSQEYLDRAAYEIGVIHKMRYSGYFLVVQDFLTAARNKGIMIGPGRGSAAGALVSYALEITQIDPIEHKLIFERFLNPERVSMPDIDIDFDDTRRGEVIEYVTEKYGADHVSQLVTFGRVKAKAAIKDAARILSKPYSLGDQITKLYPAPIVGRDMPLAGVFDPDHERYQEAEELRQLIASDPETKEVMDVAVGLEGVIRQSGVHAAGVLIGGEPLVEHIPLIKRESDGQIISAFEQKTCETLGLLKMDFLGLRNLTILTDALNHIKRLHDVELDVNKLPLDDQKTYELLQHGDTIGVFQLDSPPMRQLLKSLRPDRFDDIPAVLALYRPGPMSINAHTDYADRKNGRASVKPMHPELEEALEPILGSTYSLMIYQESILRIAQDLAGFTLGEADNLRRAIGKKDEAAMAAEEGKLLQGLMDNGFSQQASAVLIEGIRGSSSYSFNLGHAASYGMISYQTAYLKANYPSEYMAALLTSVESDKDKTALYLNECRRMGISVLPPDVNESGAHYTPVDGSTIRVGLSAVRNVGHNVVDGILEHRTRDGAYTGFADFLQKTMYASVNKRAVASLIKAGAFDSLHGNRAALDSVHERAVDQVAKLRKKNPEEKDLFDLLSEETGVDSSPKVVVDVPPDSVVADWSRLERLSFEREMLGQYVSDHPLRGMQQSLDKFSDGRVLDLFPPDGLPVVSGEFALVAGIVTSVTKKKTRKGDTYVIVSVEDLSGAVDVTVFPSTYNRNPDLWVADTVVSVKARVDVREDESFQLLASQAREVVLKPDPVGEDGVPLEDMGHPKFQRRAGGASVERDPSETVLSARVPAGSLLVLTVDGGGLSPEFVGWLRGFIGANPGGVRVHLRVVEPSGERLVVLPPELSIGLTRELVYDLKGRLGEDHVSVVPVANQGSEETVGETEAS